MSSIKNRVDSCKLLKFYDVTFASNLHCVHVYIFASGADNFKNLLLLKSNNMLCVSNVTNIKI